jgi:hypothetical protein
MTTGTEFARTDAPARLPRWLTLTLASIATLIGIGTLWALSPNANACAASDSGGPYILPGPQPCGADGSGAALVTAGILIALLAAMFVVAFTAGRRRGLVTIIISAVMLFVLLVGLLVTVTIANTAPPVIYY